MKREAAAKIYKEICGMTIEEELEYWNSTSSKAENKKASKSKKLDENQKI